MDTVIFHKKNHLECQLVESHQKIKLNLKMIVVRILHFNYLQIIAVFKIKYKMILILIQKMMINYTNKN